MLKTVKLGGSSLADSAGFRRAREIILGDDARRVIVVSAPGRRHEGDSKVTDLLYLGYACIRHGVADALMLTAVESRFGAIAHELGLSFDVAAAFGDIRARLAGGAGEAYLISRGEALCAQLMAEYLGFEYLDAGDFIRMGYDGSVDLHESCGRLAAAYRKTGGRVVIPGFYGRSPGGKLQLMSRGGSDITGAIAASALGCHLYENWTDVPGILMADPALVPRPRPIAHITYGELQDLAHAGAQVFHEESVLPVRRAGIPINIRDTGNPAAPGTMIGAAPGPNRQSEPIIGITGRKGYSMVDISGDWARLGEVLALLARRAVPMEQVLSGSDSFSLAIPPGGEDALYAALGELEQLYGQGTAAVTEGVALITCVCRETGQCPGIAGRALAALGGQSVAVSMVSQRPSARTVVVAVGDGDFGPAVNLLYTALVGGDRDTARRASAWAT